MFVGYAEIAEDPMQHGGQPASRSTSTTTVPRPIRQNANDSVQSELECSLCQDIPMVPVITPVCQHVFCRPCIEQALESRWECPNDRQPLERHNLQELSGALRRIWEAIPVRCPKDHCTWNGTLGSYTIHFQNCNPISISDYEQRIADMKRKIREVSGLVIATVSRCEAEKQQLQVSISELHVKLASTEHSNSKPFDSSYRYDRSRVAELAGVICRDLENKPSYIDRNRIFNCVKICFDDYKRGYSDNPEHMYVDVQMLLHVCDASNWFSIPQRDNIHKWIKTAVYV